MTVSKIKILASLYARLTGPLAENYVGALSGLTIRGSTVAVAAAGRKKKGDKMDLDILNEHLPCGLEPIGVFMCLKNFESADGIQLIKQLPENRQEETVPILIMREANALKAYRYTEGALAAAELEAISEEELKEQTVTVRVRGRLDLTCGFSRTEISLGFKHLIEKVTCPYGSFLLEGGQIIFLHKFVEKEPGTGWTKANPDSSSQEDEEDCVIVGPLSDGGNVEDLWQFTQPVEEDDGFGSKDSRSKKRVERRERMEFSMAWNLTNPASTTRTIGCAPIIHFEKKSAPTISLPIHIDALGLVDRNSEAKELMHILKGCVIRQLGDIASSVRTEFSLKNTVSVPEVYHFKPAGLSHLISVVYPTASSIKSSTDYRKSLHENFMLPTDRPLFRPANLVPWASSKYKNKLWNVHTSILDKHGVSGGQVAAVQGIYTYFHYMQDNFDDDGWGCAYRSLQTLISWFKQQGYTESRMPLHQDIQKCLVEIGDKEKKFIGSKQWIGSTEVGFVLETWCKIQSRFISVSSGAELSSKARDLIAHFESEGTPVMIGGGVYAHTILGVAWDEPTDTCAWLVLDPHYTGTDDLKTVLSKGWCAWKGPKFWNQTAFYNMCLPQRPKDVL